MPSMTRSAPARLSLDPPASLAAPRWPALGGAEAAARLLGGLTTLALLLVLGGLVAVELAALAAHAATAAGDFYAALVRLASYPAPVL